MKARKIVLLVVAGAIVLCGALVAALATGGGEDKPAAAVVPSYAATATKQGADLVAPGVTVDGARVVIGDWLTKHAGNSAYLVVTVVRNIDDKTFVCRGEYVADEQTASARTGGRVKGPYPATAVNCPDPKAG